MIIKSLNNIVDRKFRLKLIFIIFLSFVVQALDVLSVSTIIPIISSAINFDSNSNVIQFFITIYDYVPFLDSKNLLMSSIVFISILFAFKSIIFIYFSWLHVDLVQSVRVDICYKLLKKYLKKNWIFFLNNNSSVLIRNIWNEVPTSANLISILINFITEVFLLIVFSIFLITVATDVSIAFMCFLLFIAAFIYLIVKGPLFRLGKEKLSVSSKILKYLSQSLEGAKDIKILRKEDFFINEFNEVNVKSKKITILITIFNALPKPLIEFFAVIGISLCVYYLLSDNRGSGEVLIIIGAILGAGFRVMPSLIRLLVLTQKLRNMIPSISVIQNELNIVEDKKIDSNKKINLNNLIELKNVSYQYPDINTSAVSGINISIKKGKKIGILGKSGSGKSTLVDLLVGLIKPLDGFILSDGQDIQNSIYNWQKKIGYVSQNVNLLDDTFLKNIAIGMDDNIQLRNKIESIIRLLNLDELVNSHSDGLDRMVGERGVRMSGGQKQRIGIARAICFDPEILILDEATNSLDIHSEKNIMNDIYKISKNITTIIIAHRVTTLEHCDEVFVFEKGRVVNSGKYHDMKVFFENHNYDK